MLRRERLIIIHTAEVIRSYRWVPLSKLLFNSKPSVIANLPEGLELEPGRLASLAVLALATVFVTIRGTKDFDIGTACMPAIDDS